MPIDTHPKRCISWIAVSSKPQTEKESPDEQRQSNLAIINDVLNGRMVAELEVPGESREIISFEEACQRIDAYAQLRDILKAKSADIIVCRDVTRLGRSAALVAQVVAHCHAAGVAIYSIAMPPNSLDAREQAANQGSTIMLALEGAFAQIEMTKLKRNHMFGMLGRAKKGLFPTGGKAGWRVIRNERGDVVRIEIDEEFAECVRFVFDAYVNGGRSIRSIYTEMNRRGMVTITGLRWSHQHVVVVLDDTWKYAGYTEYNKHSKTGRPYYRGKAVWPTIIDEATAHAAIAERKRRAAGRRAVESPYLFSGVCWCAQCGARIISRGIKKYSGRRYNCDRRCRGSMINEKNLIAGISAFIENLKHHADLDAAVAIERPDMQAEYEQQLERIERQITAIAEQRKKHARNNAAGLLDDSEFAELMRETAENRLALETRRQEIETRLEHTESEEDYRQRLQGIIDAGRERLQSDDIPATNAWLRQNFRIYVANNRVTEVRVVT